MALEEQLDFLIKELSEEMPHMQAHFEEYPNQTISDKFEIFRGYCNVRPPVVAREEFLEIQDQVLQTLLNGRQITGLNKLQPIADQIYLWQGDITTLQVDAIVNAANSDMLGCTQANHNCIDNAIHTRSGIQLRLACHELIEDQGKREPMGKAKLTPAFNLPAKYVIHTVGPFIDQRGVTPLKQALLESSYQECLRLADQEQLTTIAFCCISTGEFNYPNRLAAETAIRMVKEYLSHNGSNLKVIFNVFKDLDYHLYSELLSDEGK
ncbi:protein-ADP-ribose hydrolase [Facklamia sp. DSM 111018]|uniref:Protein-ADP-ribose hydrolase n=1 Tax=Facklamia lactis TaxID=2749967 RepID=A0ABS0LPN7_9LACT|nr:protein-ADP-ribose hydrolase [Facklamia lactis]MBG9980296.1 protein-ADP-ribose hydrolase [Facklamia lactis]MBG9986099.1 protein-ADP-ribose hydrolase [Facklamia lactis]